jgi:hypothetical protein
MTPITELITIWALMLATVYVLMCAFAVGVVWMGR